MVSLPSIRRSWRRFPLFLRAAAATAPVLAVTVYLYLESRKSERLLLEAETARQADNALLQFQGFVNTRVDALKDVGNFVLTTTGDARRDDLTPFLTRLRADVPDFESITWLDKTGGVRQQVPRAAPGRVSSRASPGTTPTPAIAKAADSHRPTASDSFELAHDQEAMTLVVPVVRDSVADGAVLGTVRLTDGLRVLYSQDELDFWNFEISDRAGRYAYRSFTMGKNAHMVPAALVAERYVPVADKAWRIRVWPTPLMVSTLGTAAPMRILGIGVLATLVVAIANFLLAQRQSKLSESLSESKRLAADVEATRRHLIDMVNGIDAVIWESDAEMNRFTFVNDFARKLLGIDTARWMSVPEFWFEHVHPDDRARVRENARQANRRGQTYPAEYRMIDAAGRVLWVREIIAVIADGRRITGRRGVVVDISARVQAEEALRQTQKLESLGVLAGGIAHDFNNLLTTILGNAELLSPYLVEGPTQGKSHLEKIERTTRRLAELTRQMLAYSGRGQFTVAEVDLNAIITEMTELLTVSTPKNVRVAYRLDPALPLVEADAAQLRQVTLNLLTNASEAIGEHQPGEVAINTGTTWLDAAQAAELFPGQDVEPGDYVRLEVSDTGCGMSAETLSKIFDPFFTTKFTGRGLGLAALRGIVRRHRGGIRIFSQLGEGTVFTLLFPASSERVSRTDRVLSGDTQPAGLDGATVLIVDDEESLRTLMAVALEGASGIVIQAVDGEDGIEQFNRHRDEIDVVVLDLTMPKLNGEEAFRQIKASRPGTRVILCSGYTQEDVAQQFTGHGLAGFIEKPFTPSLLIEKIRQVLSDNDAEKLVPTFAPPARQQAGTARKIDNGRNPASDAP